MHLNAEVPAAELLAKARAQFTDYKRYYLDHGWFTDPPNGVDFYNTWAIPYDLFWIHWVDPGFEPDFIVTALHQSAELVQHLISPQGIPIMGRSICYRTAVPVPLLAANLMGTETVLVRSRGTRIGCCVALLCCSRQLARGRAHAGVFRNGSALARQVFRSG